MAQTIAPRAPKGGAAPRPLPAPSRLGRSLRWAHLTFIALPATFRAGFVLLASGALADAGYHLIHGLQSAHSHGAGFDVPTAIHLVVAAGMLTTLGGLVHAAIRSTRRSDDHKEAI